MELKKSIASLTVLSIATFFSSAQAQIETLSPEQLAAYQKDLPAAVQLDQPDAFKSYLKTLKPGPTAELNISNAVRVANDIKANPLPVDAFFGHYSVPTLSPTMRMPEAYPYDGRFAGEVGVVLAEDQYENASFVVYAFKDEDQVNLKVSPLKSAEGNTLDPKSLDLKVVKVWYQNGNAWVSYFADPGLKLVPELLLHDENLIRVDTEKRANYARIKDGKNSKEIWISSPAHRVHDGKVTGDHAAD